MKTEKKAIIHSEPAYIFANIILSLAVAMIATTGFGVSMIVAPAYLVHLKLGFLTFGQCEYLLQTLLLIVFCILLKKVKIVYLSSYITCIIYSVMLDFWRYFIPQFNEKITPVGSLPLWCNIIFFVLGMLLTALSIAIFFRIYLYPQVYDFFVKGVSERFGLNRNKFKPINDLCYFIISVILSLVFFGGFKGIGIGTIVMTVCNGFLIAQIGKLLDKFVIFEPYFPNFAKKFDII